MSRRRAVALALAAAALVYLTGRPVVCAGAEGGEKIKLRVFYVGQPGSDREKDFVGFLEKYFTKVGTADLAAFKADQAREFDVVILDTGEMGRNAARPTLAAEYARPTITLGVAGAQLSGSLKLRTGFA